MAFEPNFKRVESAFRTKLGTTQAVIECKLPANENTEISKILCTNAKSYIANTEVGEKEVEFNGFVNFLVIYESSDGVVQSLDYSAEFRDKFKNADIKITDVASVTSSVVDVNTTANNSTNDVKVVAVVEINVDIIEKNEVPVLVGATGDNVYVQTEPIALSQLSAVIEEDFDIIQDIEIKDGVAQVLGVCASSFISTVSANDGYVSLQGGVNVNITYISNSENAEVRTMQTTLDFSQEMPSSVVNNTSAVQSVLNLMYNKIKATTTLGQDTSIVGLELPLEYIGYVFNAQEIDAVVDIFSTENTLTVTTESVDTLVPESSMSYTEKISGNIVTDDSTPFIDEVLGNACNNVVLATSYIADERLIVEGIAYTTVLYFNKETESNNSIEVEIPFSLSLLPGAVLEDSTPIVSISLDDVITRVKRGKELEVGATLFIFSDFYSKATEAVITNVVVGEEKPEADCVLSIYIVKPGETIWDIAKELNVSPDLILEQNPDLQLPLVGGERIVLYRQKEILF